jgi:hypothetical protein
MTVWSWKFFDARVTDEAGLTDVLKEVNYLLRGKRDDVTHEIGGRTALGAPDPANFISFANLTEAHLIAIVGSAVNIDALKTQIDAWHDEVKKPLPFEAA